MQNVLPKSPLAVAAEFQIQLRDVLLFARHGVLPEETALGNQYRVNVRLSVDASAFDAEADDIDATVSYADVYDMLLEVMNRPTALLESVAVKFAHSVLKRWPIVKSGEIEIVKTVPPIPGLIGEAAVSYRF